MKRHEAVSIIEKTVGITPEFAAKWVLGFEQLGVLKFESEDDATFKIAGEYLANTFTEIQRDGGSYVHKLTLGGAYESLDVLRKNGFTLVRK